MTLDVKRRKSAAAWFSLSAARHLPLAVGRRLTVAKDDRQFIAGADRLVCDARIVTGGGQRKLCRHPDVVAKV